MTEDNDREILYDFIREAENLPRPANPAEIALICDLAVPRDDDMWVASDHDDFSYGGVKSISTS